MTPHARATQEIYATFCLAGVFILVFLAWVVREQVTRPDPVIAQMQAEVTGLRLSLDSAERRVQDERRRRVQVEAQWQAQQQAYTRQAASARAQVAAAQAVLADTTATLTQVRLALTEQVATTQALLATSDSMLNAGVMQALAAATERAEMQARQAVADSTIAAQADLLARLTPSTPPCRIGPLPCPSRTTTGVLTFIGTTVVMAALLL